MTGTSFSTADAYSVMQNACRKVRLEAADAQLMRLGENALYHLVSDGVVVRIARTLDYWDDVVNEVNVSRWLAEHHVPAAELYDTPQPVEVDEHPVTFWRYIPGRPGGPEDIRALGTTLRTLHATPPPTTFELPPENILGRVARRIDTAPVSTDDKAVLRQRLEKLRAELPRLDFPLAPAPTHGDAQCENLIIGDGHATLIDFERFAWGQPEWDLAITATEYLTAGWWTDDQYRQFVDAYGYDVTSWSGFELLQATHELKMTTWLMQNVNESPEIADEHRVRMQTIRGEDRPAWRPF
jgi:Ser/Thr protein kinase RdoA (MazF antagonist)